MMKSASGTAWTGWAQGIGCQPQFWANPPLMDEHMPSDLLNRITIEPGKCGGRPCIRGMRIRVQDILELLSAGASYAEILQDYPYLEEDDVRAALSYAARQMDHPILVAT